MTTLQLSDASDGWPLPPGLSEVVERRLLRRPTNENQWSLRNVLAILAIASACFTAGKSWRDLDVFREKLDTHIADEADKDKAFATKELVIEQNEETNRRLTAIEKSIDQLSERRK